MRMITRHSHARLINICLYGFAAYSKFAYGDVPEPLNVYRGIDCMEKFVEYIEQESIRLPSLFPQKPMIPSTDIEQAEYQSANQCHICRKTFDDPKNRKVRENGKCRFCHRIPLANSILLYFHHYISLPHSIFY